MRALIVSLALAVVAVICTAFVMLFASLNASSAMLASVGLGIFMVAALFAAIAALGPKARPTPFLTPAIAGTLTAGLTTVVIIVGSTHFGQAQRAAMRTGEPAKVTAPAAEMQSTASEASPIQFPGVTIVPVAPTPAPTPPMSDPVPAARTVEPPTTEPAPAPQATPPESDVAEPVVDEAPDGPTPDDAPTEAQAPAGGSPSNRSAGAEIPIPPVPPPPPAWLVLSDDVFDTSKPPTIRNRVSPPLPRDRPCGADGQPCP